MMMMMMNMLEMKGRAFEQNRRLRCFTHEERRQEKPLKWIS